MGTPQRYPCSFLPGAPRRRGATDRWPSLDGARRVRQHVIATGLLGLELHRQAATAAAGGDSEFDGILPAVSGFVMQPLRRSGIAPEIPVTTYRRHLARARAPGAPSCQPAGAEPRLRFALEVLRM